MGEGGSKSTFVNESEMEANDIKCNALKTK